MGAGYTRQAQNNIVDGAVIDSDDLNAEFNQVEAAFNSTTGHTHDGTEGEGPKIDTAGLADDAVTPAKVDSTGTFEVAGLVVGGTTLNSSNLEILDGATLSTAELNLLDGATVTTAELNILDGLTATTGELNILDGATITTTELNYLDGVTSNVQTQLDDLAGVGAGGVTNVTATAPIESSGGANPDISLTGTVPIANGGTGQTGVPADGQLLIGNGTGFTRANITAGTGIVVTNGSGQIQISSTASSDVNLATDVTGTLPVSNGGTGTTTLTSGRYLKGNGTSAIATQIGVPTSDITGTLPVSQGGTGQTSLSNGEYLVGNGTGGITTASTIPSSDVSGLPTFGTMASQNSSNVQITGGSIDGDVIDDGPIRIDNGSASSPAYSFSSDTDTGMYRVLDGGYSQLRFSAGGTNIFSAFKTSNDISLTCAGTLSSFNAPFDGFLYVKNDSSVGTNAMLMERGGSTVGTISTTTTSTSYNETSDYRLKENVVPLTDGINRVKQLAPYRFNFIVEPSRTVDGFIAHEVQDIVPQAVTGEKDAMKNGKIDPQGIDQAKLVPLLTAAVQELITRVETLESQLNTP